MPTDTLPELARECGFDGCDKPRRTRGYCQGHYAQLLRRGDLTPLRPRHEGCSVEGCNGRNAANGLCSTHYQRLRHHGTTDPMRPVRQGCSVEGCDRDHFGLGYCCAHYTRVRKYGDPGPVEIAPWRPGHGYVNAQGYRVLGNGRLEHRAVMENMLGRPLTPTEQVHHRNGDRLDNRPVNLELWLVSQPAGQRVEDALAHALGVVQQYAPHVLRDEVMA